MSTNSEITLSNESTAITADLGQVMQTLQLASTSISGLAQQMGIANARLNEHEGRMSEMDSRYDQRINDIELRVDRREQREILDNSQRRHLKQAVSSRVFKLLGIEYVDGIMTKESAVACALYSKGFYRKCYADAKRYSRMAEEFADTLAIDYDEVLRYISSWVPERYGVDGYKDYLDTRREARNDRD